MEIIFGSSPVFGVIPVTVGAGMSGAKRFSYTDTSQERDESNSMALMSTWVEKRIIFK